MFFFLPGWRPAQVTVDSNKTAVTGKRASLSCSYALPEKVQQITWKHSSAQGQSAEVASYAKRSDPMIEPPYQGRVWLSSSLSNSQLTIQPVTIQDEGCYTCLYSTHAEGQKSSTVCLATYGKHLFPWVITDCFIIHFGLAHTETKWMRETDAPSGKRPLCPSGAHRKTDILLQYSCAHMFSEIVIDLCHYSSNSCNPLQGKLNYYCRRGLILLLSI